MVAISLPPENKLDAEVDRASLGKRAGGHGLASNQTPGAVQEEADSDGTVRRKGHHGQ